MRKKRGSSRTNSLKTALIFCAFVSVLLVASVIFKTLVILSKSNFDGSHRFTVAVEEKEGRTSVISFSPQTRSISLLKVNKVINKAIPTLQLPVDSFVKVRSANILPKIEYQGVPSYLFQIAKNYQSITTDVTIIDLLRLFLFARTVPQHNVQSGELTLPAEDYRADRLAAGMFADLAIAEEKLSVEVINGTSIFGLGNRLGRYVTNMGGNVVAVSSADSVRKDSKIIYTGNKTYTAEKLSKLLHFPLSRRLKLGISDILIVVGTDKEGELVF